MGEGGEVIHIKYRLITKILNVFQIIITPTVFEETTYIALESTRNLSESYLL